MAFSISERYTLKISWDKVEYNKEGVCKLIGAKFSGPALSIAAKIQPDQYISLDFYKQYFLLVQNAYVAKFNWQNVIYNKDNTVSLPEATITHDTELNRVPKFKDSDFILIDTSDHEESKHRFSLVYVSYVVNENGILYDFR